MYNAANSGLIIAVEKLIPLLPESMRENAQIAMDSHDWEEVESILFDYLPQDSSLDCCDCVFVYNGDEPNDTLEEGKMYAMWDANENPFYERKLTAEGEKLKQQKMLPEFAQWVTLG